MSTIVYMKKNDRLPLLRVALKDSSGSALSLSGASVKFRMRKKGATDLKVDASASVIDAATGIAQYSWAAGDTDTPGKYDYEFVVTIGGLAETTPSQGYGQLIVADVLHGP